MLGEPESGALFEPDHRGARVRGVVPAGEQRVEVVRHEAIDRDDTGVFFRGGFQR